MSYAIHGRRTRGFAIGVAAALVAILLGACSSNSQGTSAAVAGASNCKGSPVKLFVMTNLTSGVAEAIPEMPAGLTRPPPP